MASWPALKDVRTFLRRQVDPVEDAVIDVARLAAIDYGVRRLGSITVVYADGSTTTAPTYPADTTDLPDVIAHAATIHAARLYRRRDSVDGTLGFGDAGVIRVGRFDADIEAAYSVVGPVVFA
jgi:hypothetical protein